MDKFELSDEQFDEIINSLDETGGYLIKRMELEYWIGHFIEIEKDEFIKTNKSLLDVLKEIAKGEGAYDIDELKHASNTIDNMKDIAKKAITNFGIKYLKKK